MNFIFSKKILLISGGIIIAAVCIFYFSGKSGLLKSPKTTKNMVNESNVSNENTNSQLINNNAQATSSPVFIDTDNDGLTDDKEKELGTDPNNIDTDKDGLTDAAEKIYQTNPLNSDTDNDGYKDGEEIKNGYDPRKKDAKLPSAPPGSAGW